VQIWNARYMTAAIDHLHATQPDVVADEHALARVAPIAHAHVNSLGRYKLNRQPPAAGHLRPLRVDQDLDRSVPTPPLGVRSDTWGPESVARRYIQLSNAVDYHAMADLFTEDAEWIPISPTQPRRGREAIRDGYLRHVKATNRPIVNDRYYTDANTCVVEFEVDLGEQGTAAIVDIFTINDHDEITRLAVYRR